MRKPIEIVLPSGRFATIRPPNVGDLSADYSVNPIQFVSNLAVRIVKIDGKPITAEEVAQMDMDEFTPLMNHISDFLLAVSQRGIA